MLDALIIQCAAEVAPSTMQAIVQVESGGYPWIIGDNTTRSSVKLPTREAAVAEATSRISKGHSIDIGLSQINSRNLKSLGLSVAEVFDPCINLNAGAKILAGFYKVSSGKYGPGQTALLHALSAYNTGSLYAGAPYVRRILAAAGRSSNYMNASFKRSSPYADKRAPFVNQILVFPHVEPTPPRDTVASTSPVQTGSEQSIIN